MEMRGAGRRRRGVCIGDYRRGLRRAAVCPIAAQRPGGSGCEDGQIPVARAARRVCGTHGPGCAENRHRKLRGTDGDGGQPADVPQGSGPAGADAAVRQRQGPGGAGRGPVGARAREGAPCTGVHEKGGFLCHRVPCCAKARGVRRGRGNRAERAHRGTPAVGSQRRTRCSLARSARRTRAVTPPTRRPT